MVPGYDGGLSNQFFYFHFRKTKVKNHEAEADITIFNTVNKHSKATNDFV